MLKHPNDLKIYPVEMWTAGNDLWCMPCRDGLVKKWAHDQVVKEKRITKISNMNLYYTDTNENPVTEAEIRAYLDNSLCVRMNLIMPH
jgi:hypothetical protein